VANRRSSCRRRKPLALADTDEEHLNLVATGWPGVEKPSTRRLDVTNRAGWLSLVAEIEAGLGPLHALGGTIHAPGCGFAAARCRVEQPSVPLAADGGHVACPCYDAAADTTAVILVPHL
jgi:hypothetical protein